MYTRMPSLIQQYRDIAILHLTRDKVNSTTLYIQYRLHTCMKQIFFQYYIIQWDISISDAHGT